MFFFRNCNFENLAFMVSYFYNFGYDMLPRMQDFFLLQKDQSETTNVMEVIYIRKHIKGCKNILKLSYNSLMPVLISNVMSQKHEQTCATC